MSTLPFADDLHTLAHQLRANPPPVAALPGDLSADEALAALRADGTWADLDYSDSIDFRIFPSSAHLRRANLILDSPATAAPGERDRRRHVAHQALSSWLRLDPQTGQGWYQTIGVPQWIGRLALEFENELTPAEKKCVLAILRRCVRTDGELIYANAPATGQNLQWQASLQIVAGCMDRDAAQVERYVRRIERELQITEEEGIQAGLSFQQHGRQLYAGGYGLGFTTDAARLAVQTRGTRFALKPETVDLLTRFLLDGQQGMLRGARWDFTTIGREIARGGRDAAPLAAAADQLASFGGPRAEELRGLARRLRGEESAGHAPAAFRVFWRSDFVSQTQPEFHFSVRMTSTRMNGSEAGNGENELGAYLGDGATTLMRTGDEYHGIFPMWDWRRIPGVTNTYQPEVPLPIYDWSKGYAAGSDFAGGTGDGANGLAAMELSRLGVHAHKAWFFIGDSVVCLGAGIRADDAQAPLITTINQCFAKGALQTSGTPSEVNAGATFSLQGPGWIHHDGVAYLNLDGNVLHAQIVQQTGSWKDVDQLQGSPETLANDVFSAWIEHGEQPAAYAYIVAPGLSPEGIPAYEKQGAPQVLINTESLQAVASAKGEIVQIAFWSPGELLLPDGGKIQADSSCLLQLRTLPGGRWTLAVSNPTQKACTLHVRLSRSFTGSMTRPDGEGTLVTFHFPANLETAGKPQVCELLAAGGCRAR